MNETSSLEKIEEPLLSHVLAMIHLLFAYFLSDNIVWILSRTIPQIFTFLAMIFQELTLTIALVFFYLLLIRLQTQFLPFLNPSQLTSSALGIVTLLILNHPLIISFEGTKIKILWLILDIVKLDSFLTWILETLLIGVSGYFSILIMNRMTSNEQSRYAKYLPYIAQDILTGLFIVLVVFYLVRSFVIESFESITITVPIKLVLVFLFHFSIAPEISSNNAF